MIRKNLTKLAMQGALASSALLSGLASATIVQFQTSLGNFEVNLYDKGTPGTVANFLAYMDAGTYDKTIVHRVHEGFVMQGGGFAVNDEGVPFDSENTWSPRNEPVYSNVEGTIAMAKVGGDPNSATNQWFINLRDNSASLDAQNGGFTVFGEVIGDGMEVVKRIAAIKTFDLFADSNLETDERTENISGAFTQTPMVDFTEGDLGLPVESLTEHMVLIDAVVVTDAAEDTAAALTPQRNVYTKAAVRKKKKGGAFDWLALLALASVIPAAVKLHRR